MALLIKYKAGDDGSRHDVCGNSNPYWLNPNIFMTVPGAGGVMQDIGTTATEGQDITLNVRLWNTNPQGGAALGKTRVQVWVSDYTTLPHQAFTALDLQPGTKTATGVVLSIPAGVNAPGVEVACEPKWHVTPGQAASLGNHVCLVANCYLDDGTEGTEGSPNNNPFYNEDTNTTDFCANPRHAQRNITVVAAAPHGKAPNRPSRFDIPIMVVNPDLRHQRPISLQMTHAVGRHAFGPIEKAILKTSTLRHLYIHQSKATPSKFGLASREGKPSCKVRVGNSAGQQLNFVLDPKTKVPVQITAEFNGTETAGSLHTFDIIQRNERGQVMGGARLLAVISP